MIKLASLFGAAALLCAAISLFGAPSAPQARITLVERNAAPSAQPGAQASVVRRSIPGRPDREAYRFGQVVHLGSPVTEMVEVAFQIPTTLTNIEASNDFHTAGGTCLLHRLYNPGQTCIVNVTLQPKGPGNRAGLLTFSSEGSPTPDVVGLQGATMGAALSFVPAQINTMPQTVKAGGGGLIYSEGDVVLDQGDNLYFSDLGGMGSKGGMVYGIDSSGTLEIQGGVGGTELTAAQPILPAASIALNSPDGLAVNPFLLISVAEFGNNSIDLLGGTEAYLLAGLGSKTASTCTPGSECLGTAVSLEFPSDVRVDQAGNMFFTDMGGYYESNGNLLAPSIYFLKNVASGAGLSAAASFGIDSLDNIYAGGSNISNSECQIYGVNPATGFSWAVAGSGVCGSSGNNVRAQSAEINTNIVGFGFDAAGDMYFADTMNNEVRRVDSYNGLIRTVAGTAVGAGYVCNYYGDGGPATDAAVCGPSGAAVDSNGVLYTQSDDGTDASYYLIRQIGPAGQRNFPVTLVGKSSPVMTVLLTNTGNDDLVVSNQMMAGSSGNSGVHPAANGVVPNPLEGSNPADFVMDPATSSCVWTTPLKPGRSCQLGYSFQPTAGGARSATVLFVDNTATFQNTLYLNGYALATPTPTTTTFTAPAAASTYIAGSSVPVGVTVANSLTASLNLTGTMTVTLKDVTKGVVKQTFPTLALSPGAKPNTSAIVSFGISNLAPDNYQLVATYNGDSLNATSTSAPIAFNISQVTPVVTINAPIPTWTMAAGAPIAASVTVSNAGMIPTPPGAPTGTVTLNFVEGSATFTRGPYTLTAGSNGTSTVSVPSAITSPLPGNWTVSASYNGDTPDATATSAVVPFKVIQVTPTITVTSPVSGTSLIAGTLVPTTVKVTNAGLTNYTAPAPTGGVMLTFAEGATSLVKGPFTLTPGANGVSTVAVSNPIGYPAVGSWTVTAAYSGDTGDNPVTTTAIPFTVVQLTPTVTITSPGSGFAFVPDAAIATAVSVSNAGKTPTPTGAPIGSVTLTYVNGNNAPIKVGPLTLTAGSSGISTASSANPITGIQAGNWTVTASYSGDTEDVSAGSAAIPFTVSQVTPAIQLLTPTATSYAYGTSIPLQAQVSNYGLHPTDPSSPSGLVTFKLTNKTTNVTQSIGGYGLFNYSSGVARTPSTTTLTALTVAQYTLYAVYSGDAADAPVTSATITFNVTAAVPTINWPTPATVAYGTKLTSTQLDAVASALGSTLQGAYVYTPPVGTAMTTSGSITLKVNFTPNDKLDFTNASDSVQLQVLLQPPSAIKTTTLLASTENPARRGQTLQIVAMVNPASGTAMPIGSVTFAENGKMIATAPVSSGVAKLSLTGLTLGTHMLTASYSGDRQHQGSTSLPLKQIVVTINALPDPITPAGKNR